MPSISKPQDKKADKIKALFGMGNPFDKLKKNKTLIATPSKFEIRNEPEPIKRGRGRPRKEENTEATGDTGIRSKLKQTKTE